MGSAKDFLGEPEFFSHCDEPGCDLGYMKYLCPNCGKHGQEFGECWFGRFEEEKIDFACEHCKTPLVMERGETDWWEIRWG